MQAIKRTSLAFAIGFTELSRAAAQINNVTLRSLANSGMTMVCVTHEVGFAREVADRVIFLADGYLIEDTTPNEFFNNPKEERTRKFLSQILH